MAVVLASGIALSLATGVTSTELITGDSQFVGPGTIELFAKQSAGAATGIRAKLTVGGVPLMDDKYVPYAGTAGTLDMFSNQVVSQKVGGGRVGLTFRNDSAGTLTVDYVVRFTPGK